MIKVYFESWMNRNDEKDFLNNSLKQQVPNNSYTWKNIKGVSNVDECDIKVCFEFERNKSNRPKILLKKEPNHINGKKTLIEKGFSSNKPYIAGGVWWIKNKPFNELDNLEYPKKSKDLSTVMSSKNYFPGHKIRREILLNYINNNSEKIDVYGREDIKHLIDKKAYKGRLSNENRFSMVRPDMKYNGLIDYKYHLAIENSQKKDYWTEKISDPFLCWTMPIYLGCLNILDYFPKESLHIIDTSKNINEQINNIINKPITNENIEAMRKSRQLILYKYNIWEIVNNIIEEKYDIT